MAHGLGAEVFGHFGLHVPGLEQGHGHTAKLFNIGTALNGPGLGFQFKLAGKGGLDQKRVGRLRNATNLGPSLAGKPMASADSGPLGFGIPLRFALAVLPSQPPGSSEKHVHPLIDSDLPYWQGMRQALETAGDTQSAIYKRAVSITEQNVDPLDTEGPSS